MASNVTSKSGPSQNVVYDSRNDTSTGKKRAVIATGGKSVAERARLFGTQVHVAPPKIEPVAPKRNFVIPKRQEQQRNKSPDRRPIAPSSYSIPVKPTTRQPNARPANVRPAPAQISFRPRREPSPQEDAEAYSRVIRPRARTLPDNNDDDDDDYPPLSSTRQRSVPKNDRFQDDAPLPSAERAVYTPVVRAKPKTYPDNPPMVSAYDQPIPSPYQASNYFQPIPDPLEDLLKTRPQTYTQVSAPASTGVYTADLRSFDLGSLLNRIQDDYVQNIRPFVASVQYVETNPALGGALTGIGPVTPGITRRGFPEQNAGVYQRPQDLSRSEYVMNNGIQAYEQLFTKQPSTHRPRRRRRYHNQATSPINILGSSNAATRRRPSDNPSPKPPTPPPTSPSEHEEEKKEAPLPTPVEPAKPPEKVSSSEEEEESSSEEESTAKPATTVATVVPSKPTVSTTPATIAGRPPLPSQSTSAAARATVEESDSDETDSDESDSDSDSDSDEDSTAKNKKNKKKQQQQPTPSPAVRPTNPVVSRSTPALQPPTRTVPARTSADQLPAVSNTAQSEIPESSTKFTEKKSIFKKFTSIFRRKKHE